MAATTPDDPSHVRVEGATRPNRRSIPYRKAACRSARTPGARAANGVRRRATGATATGGTAGVGAVPPHTGRRPVRRPAGAGSAELRRGPLPAGVREDGPACPARPPLCMRTLPARFPRRLARRIGRTAAAYPFFTCAGEALGAHRSTRPEGPFESARPLHPGYGAMGPRCRAAAPRPRSAGGRRTPPPARSPGLPRAAPAPPPCRPPARDPP